MPPLMKTAALAALLLACRASPYRCDATRTCESGSICTPEGYCAKPSPVCLSGYAYTNSAASPGDCTIPRDAMTDRPDAVTPSDVAPSDVSPSDAEPSDAEPVDVAHDASPPDASPPDASPLDASPPDASPPDGGACPLSLRAIAPISGTRLRARDVELRVRRARLDGTVEFQVSRDASFATLESLASIAASGADVVATVRLARGLWFWRARSICGGAGSPWTLPWTVWSHGESARTQSPLGWVPDLDLDGHGDLAIGYPHLQRTIVRPNGTVEVLFGHPGATSPSRAAASVIEGRVDGFGAEVAIVPDMNGDGGAELAIGGCVRAPSAVCTSSVWIYTTSPASSSDHRALRLLGRFAPSTSTTRFGASIAGVGDLDSDGYGDLVIGSPDDDALGSAWVIFGPPTSDGIPVPIGSPTVDRGARVGWSVAGVGDVTGDNVADFALTSFNGAWLFGGGARTMTVFARMGLSTIIDTTHGVRASLAGDLNADGVADVAIARPAAVNGKGEIAVFNGGADAIATWATPASRVEGTVVGAHLGVGLEGGCELTGDARDDLVASAPDVAGYVAVVPGASNVDTLRVVSFAGTPVQPGRALAVLGDFDRAGGDDFAVTEGIAPVRVHLFRSNNVGAVVQWATLGPVDDPDWAFALGGR
ncbi:MAG: hypothetical protein U0326_37855 [Polyangiales bacterium]